MGKLAIDNPELLSFLQQEEQSAKDDALDVQRATALELYQGMPFGNEVEGRSQLVTRDVAEVTDYFLASILRTMFSGERVVEFEAKSQAEQDAADDASELIQYQFMRSQDGYTITHDWLKEGLLEKTGVIKTWVEQRSKDVQTDTPAEMLAQGPDGLMLDGLPVVASEHMNPDEVVIDELTGEALPAPELFRVTVRQPLPPKFMDAVVPNEEFRVASDARDLDAAVYLCHRTPKSLSDLVAMGFEFDPDTLWADQESRIISDARDAERSRRDDEDQRRGAMRRVWLSEEYVLYDLNGDGIAERLCIHRVGTTILSIVEVDDHPFEEWCPFPMTARRVGQSAADKTADIQVVRSTLLRQAMDSLYLSTNPRTLLHEDSISENTIEDLLTVRSGGLIRHKGMAAPSPWKTLAVHGEAFEGMNAMTAERESRTGITRMNQGLDADLFNRTSATGTLALQNAGQQMQEYVARNFVQSGVARLFAKKYRLMRKYGSPVELIVDGQPRTIDPRTWPEEMDIQVRVGLGTNNKDVRIGALSQILSTQVEGMQSGSPLVSWDKMYNTSRKLIQAMGVGNPSDYLVKPDPQQQAPQDKPDPEVIKAQTEQMKAQGEEQRKNAQLQSGLQMERAAAAAKIEIQRSTAQQESDLRRARAEEEARLALERQEFEKTLAVERLAFDQEMARRKVQMADVEDETIPSYRPGGDLAQ